ncbi:MULTISPECIES: type II toxin-antitoxin system HicA family toxin [Burkholderiaceae]|uniref:type II toxin-antitoxin system HicA family toxin n=1 Tax=Burkholderiaceae TaxID=119060 RepID=UPI0009DF3D22|nr:MULTISPECIES: type II toxin-antitoxin system HicA family toxin [Burkholderiaceae]
MKYSEFRKWLRKQGATFERHRSGSSHYRVTLNGKTTIFPDHGAKEMGTFLVEAIKKQLVSNEPGQLRPVRSFAAFVFS